MQRVESYNVVRGRRVFAPAVSASTVISFDERDSSARQVRLTAVTAGLSGNERFIQVEMNNPHIPGGAVASVDGFAAAYSGVLGGRPIDLTASTKGAVGNSYSLRVIVRRNAATEGYVAEGVPAFFSVDLAGARTLYGTADDPGTAGNERRVLFTTRRTGRASGSVSASTSGNVTTVAIDGRVNLNEIVAAINTDSNKEITVTAGGSDANNDFTSGQLNDLDGLQLFLTGGEEAVAGQTVMIFDGSESFANFRTELNGLSGALVSLAAGTGTITIADSTDLRLDLEGGESAIPNTTVLRARATRTLTQIVAALNAIPNASRVMNAALVVAADGSLMPNVTRQVIDPPFIRKRLEGGEVAANVLGVICTTDSKEAVAYAAHTLLMHVAIAWTAGVGNINLRLQRRFPDGWKTVAANGAVNGLPAAAGFQISASNGNTTELIYRLPWEIQGLYRLQAVGSAAGVRATLQVSFEGY